MSRLRFEIKGDPNGIALPTYSVATVKVLQLLTELDRAISGAGPSLNWYVSDLSKNGTVMLEVQSRVKAPPKGQKSPRRDVSRSVAESFVTTFENIEDRGISPPYLSEYGLEKLQKMMSLLHKNGAKGYKATLVDTSRSVDVTEEAEKTLRQLLPPAKVYEGSVEGRLETISVHGKTRFILYHAITKKAVTCHISKEQLQVVKDALGHKVLADGVVTINVKSEPIRMDVASIRVLANRLLPLASQLTGSDPEFTGDLSTDEYIRSIRSG